MRDVDQCIQTDKHDFQHQHAHSKYDTSTGTQKTYKARKRSIVDNSIHNMAWEMRNDFQRKLQAGTATGTRSRGADQVNKEYKLTRQKSLVQVPVMIPKVRLPLLLFCLCLLIIFFCYFCLFSFFAPHIDWLNLHEPRITLLMFYFFFHFC